MADNDQMNGADHDLLIRLDTKMDRAAKDISDLHSHVNGVRTDVQSMTASMDAKVAAAMAVKIDREDVLQMKADADKLHEDHERRLRILERYVWTAIGALAIIQIIIAFAK